MEHPTINDLPTELLEMIFDHLDVDDLKDASRVCRRWYDLTFAGRRIDRVKLVLKFPRDKDVFQSNRKYRHLELGGEDFAYAKKIFQAFNISSLRIIGHYSLHFSSRLILLEVPNLQHLSIVGEPFEMNEMIEPLPVMRKLERLEIGNNLPESALPWHTIAPSLYGLKMFCDSEDQLEQWRLLSGQLKHVYATFRRGNLLYRFCAMTSLPLVEELSITSIHDYGRHEQFVQRYCLFRHHEFFRRIASLRRLRLDGIYLCKTLVEDIVNHSQQLMSLEIIGINLIGRENEGNCKEGSLESLAKLTELEHLRLDNLSACIFRGCEALHSLQSLCINETTFDHKGTLGFLEDLLKIAPQLRCLELGCDVIPARAIYFICSQFTKLTRLQLTYSEVVSCEGLYGIDRLLHLCYLELMVVDTKKFFISIIPKNKVRYLTLHLEYKYDEDDLLRLPEIFPQLGRLNLINGCLRESTVNRLRQLLPTCAINIYGQLITNAGIRCVRKWTRSEMMPAWEKEWVWEKRI